MTLELEIYGDLSGGLPRAPRARRRRMAASSDRVEWIPSPNYTAGRSGVVRLITDHWIVGTLEVAVATFRNASRRASSTYVVGASGRIVQMVAEGDTPWTNGNLSHSVAVTIEHEGGPDTPMTDAMYEASAWLHRDVSERLRVPLELTGPQASPWPVPGVLRHRDTGAATQCSGTLELERIITEAGRWDLDEATVRRILEEVLKPYREDVRATFEAVKAAEQVIRDDGRTTADAIKALLHDHIREHGGT